MVSRIFNLAFGAVVGQFLKHRIRRGSIQAVKAYIQAVSYARLALLGLVGLIAATALMVTGLLLAILGLLELLPISEGAVAVTTLVLGLVLAIGIGAAFLWAFSQRRWLAWSKSYEMMDAVLSPWNGVLPPNPVDAFKGRAPQGGLEAFERDHEQREQLMKALEREAAAKSSAATTPQFMH